MARKRRVKKSGRADLQVDQHRAPLVQNLAHLQEALQVVLREAPLNLHGALLAVDLEAHPVVHLVAHQ